MPDRSLHHHGQCLALVQTASDMPSSRHTCLTYRPTSTCFSVATFLLSVNLLLRIVGFLGASFPGDLWLCVDQDYGESTIPCRSARRLPVRVSRSSSCHQRAVDPCLQRATYPQRHRSPATDGVQTTTAATKVSTFEWHRVRGIDPGTKLKEIVPGTFSTPYFAIFYFRRSLVQRSLSRPLYHIE
jgi:hypothetical protein